MFICLKCGEVFLEPGTYREKHPYGDTYAEELFACCPECSGEITEASQCSQCGTYVPDHDINGSICEECMMDNKKCIAKAIANLFTKEEFNNLPDDIFDDIWENVENAYKEEVNQ